ncbi:hypothetical protein [Legionella rowbothamii]|uniref:hypothetical protein n=1 Tax=Legionella rowbothamii TaxID=96229 RepID=UPI0013EF7D45|nr:hypothetical protein [Legionella rowbothamii]
MIFSILIERKMEINEEHIKNRQKYGFKLEFKTKKISEVGYRPELNKEHSNKR